MNLRDIRKERGWTQTELAKRGGWKPSAIGHWEAGRRDPSLTNAIRLSRVLSVTLDQLCIVPIRSKVSENE